MNIVHRTALVGMLLLILVVAAASELGEAQLDKLITWFMICMAVFLIIPRHLNEEK